MSYRYIQTCDDENMYDENLCCDKSPPRRNGENHLQSSLERNKNCQNRPHSCVVDFPHEEKNAVAQPLKETCKPILSSNQTRMEADLLSTTVAFEPLMGKRRLLKSLTEPNFRGRERLNLVKATKAENAHIKEKTFREMNQFYEFQIYEKSQFNEGRKKFLRKLSFQESSFAMLTEEKEKSKSENQLFTLTKTKREESRSFTNFHFSAQSDVGRREDKVLHDHKTHFPTDTNKQQQQQQHQLSDNNLFMESSKTHGGTENGTILSVDIIQVLISP